MTIVLSRVSLATVMMLVLFLTVNRLLLRFGPVDIWFFLVYTLSMLGLNVFYIALGTRCLCPW